MKTLINWLCLAAIIALLLFAAQGCVTINKYYYPSKKDTVFIERGNYWWGTMPGYTPYIPYIPGQLLQLKVDTIPYSLSQKNKYENSVHIVIDTGIVRW